MQPSSRTRKGLREFGSEAQTDLDVRLEKHPAYQNIHLTIHRKECAHGKTITSDFLPVLLAQLLT